MNDAIHFCPNCHMPLMGNLECDECGHQFRITSNGVVQYADVQSVNDDLTAENERLRAIVATLADLHNDGNPAKVIELCKQYKVDIPYWLGGGVVEVEALRRVAHELIYYSDTLTKGERDGA